MVCRTRGMRRPTAQRWALLRWFQGDRVARRLAPRSRRCYGFPARKSLPGAPVLSTESTAFFSRTYDEALDLVEAARSYLRVLEPIDRRSLRASERVRLCSETMRMTARLTQIMAWLLSQRAVQSGEISRAEALEDQQVLTEVQICMTQDERAWRGLPQRLVSLLDKSHRLYIRVARLDELARRSVN